MKKTTRKWRRNTEVRRDSVQDSDHTVDRPRPDAFRDDSQNDPEQIRAYLLSHEPEDSQYNFEDFFNELMRSIDERRETSRRFREGISPNIPPIAEDVPLWKIECRVRIIKDLDSRDNINSGHHTDWT